MKTCSRSLGSQPRITQIDFSRTDNRQPITDNRVNARCAFTLPKQRERFSAAKADPAIHGSRFTSARRGGRGAPGGMPRCPTSDVRRLTSGFTLIELLVVIIMIVILAALLYPAINGAQNQAKKVQAKNDVTQIVSAVNAFYTEYGKYPLVTTDTVYGPEGTSSADLFYTLRAVAAGANALVNGVPAINPRAIVFMSPPNVKDQTQPRSGIAPTTVTVNGISIPAGSLVDPWGTPYNVKLNGNYNNQLSNPYSDSDGSAGGTTLYLGVISWSWGADQKKGNPANSNKYKNSDDVISWQ